MSKTVKEVLELEFIRGEDLNEGICDGQSGGDFALVKKLCVFHPILSQLVDPTLGDMFLSTMVRNGDNTITHTDGNGSIFSFNEGNTLTDNGDGTYTVIRPDGTAFTIDTCGCNTTLVNNNDGTYTYTSEDGTATTFNAGWTKVVDNNNGTITINYPDGSAQIVNICCGSVTYNGDGTYTYDDGRGNTSTFGIITTLVDNGDGTMSYTSEDGTVTIFNHGWTTVTDNGDGTWTVTYPDATTTTIGDTSVSTLVDNGDNTFTYTDEAGTVTVIDHNKCYPKTVYSIEGTPGVQAKYWLDDEMAVQRGEVSALEAFQGPVDQFGLPTHENSPDFIPVIPNFDSVPQPVQDTTGEDQAHLRTCLYVPKGGIVLGNAGIGFQSSAIFVNGNLVQDTVNLWPANDPVTTLSAGLHQIDAYMHDPLQGGFIRLMWSLDGGATFVTIPVEYLFVDAKVVCREILFCESDGNHYEMDGTTPVTVGDFNSCCAIPGKPVPTRPQETETNLVDNGNGTCTYTNERGDTATFKHGWSTLTDNGDGTSTLVYPDGTVSVIAIGNGFTVIVDNGDGAWTATHPDGTVVTINSCCGEVTDNGDGTWTYSDGNGNDYVFGHITTLVDNGDGTWTHTSEDGTVTTFEGGWTTVISNNDGTLTFTYPDGATYIVDLCAELDHCEIDNIGNVNVPSPNDGDIIYYDQSTQTWISNNINQLETITTLVNNGDGTWTYTNEDGNTTVINTGAATIVNNNDGTYIYTYPNGSTQVVDICDALQHCELTDIGNVDVPNPVDCDLLKFDSGSGNWIPESIENIETITTLVDNGDGTYTYISEDGTSTTIMSGNITVTVNADNSVTYTYPNGTTVTYQEIITTLVDNGDGTYSYTSEDGTVTIIDTTADSNPVENPLGGTIFDDASGSPTVEELLNLIASRLVPIAVNTTCCAQPVECVYFNGTSSHSFDADNQPEELIWELKDEDGGLLLTFQGAPGDPAPIGGLIIGGTIEMPKLNFKEEPATEFMTCLSVVDQYGAVSPVLAQAPLNLLDESIKCPDGSRIVCADGTCVLC